MLAAESEAKEATSKLFLRDFAQQVGCMVAGDAVWGHPGNEVFVCARYMPAKLYC